VRPIILRLCRRRVFVAALIATLLSCGTRQHPQPSPLSPDEQYLVDAYIHVRRAGSYYPYQRTIADSLLTMLAGSVDTVRVARTIASLNATPERWSFVLQVIENRLSGHDSTETSESPGN
jgi:hypothetical protein